MRTLVNIVHPTMYKLQGKALVIGPVPEFEERDKKVVAFLRKALASGANVLSHLATHPNTFGGAMEGAALTIDPLYEEIFSRDYENMGWVVTTPRGMPIPDKRPEEIPEERWENYVKLFTQHAEMKGKVGENDLSLFIGGVLEACLPNAMGYHNDHFKGEGERMVYVPSICVCSNEKRGRDARYKLAKRGIFPVSLGEAMVLLDC